MKPFTLCAVLAIAPLVPLAAQTPADSAGIRQAALDYIEGWYEGNAGRMERAVHPDLAERIINTDPRGRNVLGHQFVNTASVRVDAGAWIDYMHVAKWNGRWVIVNVLWENRP